MSFEFVDYKKNFPLLAQNDIAYLDNAATAQRPAAVLDAMRDFYTAANANPLRGLYALAVDATDRYEAARAAAARFVNAAEPAEIVFTRNTTESINLVAYTWALQNLHAGDALAVTIMEHHSNLLPWQMAAERTGAALKFLECRPDGTLPEDELDRVLTPEVRFAAVGQLSNVLGCRNPVEEIARRVHANGGRVLVDAAQSAPHIPVDVQALDADFLAFSGHKLMGPMGVGVLYARRALLEEMPPFLRGGEMIEYVTREGATWAEVPHKLEAGTVNAGGAVGLAAAIGYLQGVGLDKAAAQEDALTRRAMEGMAAVPGVRVLGSADPADHHGIVSFVVDGVHPHDVAAIMDAAGVAVRAGHHCAQPLLRHLGVQSCTRASLAFYNTPADVDRFLNVLSDVRREMGYAESLL